MTTETSTTEEKTFEKVLKFTVRDVTYDINFPTNREFIRIQNLKISLASNIDAFKFGGAESSYAEVLVEVESHLSVLCPKLIKDLNKNFGDLTLAEGREITLVYSDVFRPWYNYWLNFVFQANKEEKTNNV